MVCICNAVAANLAGVGASENLGSAVYSNVVVCVSSGEDSVSFTFLIRRRGDDVLRLYASVNSGYSASKLTLCLLGLPWHGRSSIVVECVDSVVVTVVELRVRRG